MMKSGESADEQKDVYERVFAYGSLQFCGHIEEYLAAHTTDLMMFIVQPRVGAHQNILRRYHKGRLVEERKVRSSQNLFFYYFLWYVNHVKQVLLFSPKGKRTLVVGGHPVVFFGMGLLKRVRPLVYAYWIGDYFPSSHPVIRLYEQVKKGYHDRVSYAFYLSDAINRVMNDGVVVNTPRRRTVMWGLKPFPAVSVPPPTPFTLLFVGLLRPGQGLEQLFDFLVLNPDCHLSLIGVGQPDYVAALQSHVQESGLAERVFFPNRFYSEAELVEAARTCHVGIALYDTAEENFTHYADPGKVKAYAEMHLPVLMTRISDIVPYVERFGSGEVIGGVEELKGALERVRTDYPRYREGVERFSEHFAFERYYGAAFVAWKECWK